MKEETRAIAERLERMQHRYYTGRLVLQVVTALAVIASAVALVYVLVDVHELQEDNAQRQQCLIDLAYALDGGMDIPPPLPRSCQQLPPPPEVPRDDR